MDALSRENFSFGSFQSDSLSSLCFKLHWWNIIEDLGEGEAGELVRGFKPVSEKYTH